MNAANLQFLRRSFLALAVTAMVACSWLAPLDAVANRQVDAGLKRALISFATARALNAIISVAQGTEVAIEPGGVGVVLTPGQMLEPINDLVEKFSSLMLVASVSFGVQKALIAIGAFWPVSLLLSMTALAWIFFYLRQQRSPSWLAKILVILLMTRFAVPVVTLGSDILFQQFMAADYQSSQHIIDTASGQLSKLHSPTAASTAPVPSASEDKGLLEKFKGWWSQNSEVKLSFEQIQQAAERAIEQIIKLIVIFLLQTLVIPLLLLWGLYGVAKEVFYKPPRAPIRR
jgi:hypothetical protein